jgi:hypothetical protein
MNSLSFQLSPSDAALFESLQASALLPTLAEPGEGELVELYKQRKREENKKHIEPYADLLEIDLVKMLEARKASILQQLKESKDSNFTAKLFSWNSVGYHESLSGLQRRQDGMTTKELSEHNVAMRERQFLILENDWESMFSVEGTEFFIDADGRYNNQPFTSRYPVKVDRIFNNSDLANRLSLKLGPNFFPYIEWEPIQGAGDESAYGYSVYKKTLCARYYPFGVKKGQLMKLLATARTDAERISLGKKSVYAMGERGVDPSQLNILPALNPEDEYADMPSLISPVDRHHCFCGCQQDDDE